MEQINHLERKLTSRHIQMIAIGGTIGTGVFIGSGATIAQAGPLGALIGYSITGIMVYAIMTSLGELATHFPVSGSFTTYGGLFVSESMSFALGWNYWIQWAISFPTELSAAGMIMSFWFPQVPSFLWAGLILVTLTSIHLCGVKSFGETEYWLSMIKVVAIILFIIFGGLIDFGIVGQGRSIGFENWNIEGAPLKNGTVGIFNVFLMAFFSFGGTELVGITAGEAENPKVTIPKAIKNTFWRIMLFYIFTILVMGLVIRNDDPSLLNSSLTGDITISPFTLVFQRAGLSFAANAMNGVVFSAVLSAGNSALFAASRTLMALSEEGKAPMLFSRLNHAGVPYFAILVTSLFGCLSFFGIFLGDGVLFLWLINVTGISGILTWLSIAFIHIRFRQAFEAQEKDLASLVYRSPFYPIGPVIAIILGFFIIGGQGYAALQQENAMLHLFVAYLGIPLYFGLFFGYRYFKNAKFVPLKDINLDRDSYESLLDSSP
jgi:lysine-specific permease